MKRVLAIGSGVTIAALLAIVSLIRDRQTGFGEIKRAKLTESHSPTRLERVVSDAKKVLRLATVDTRQRNYLAIGNAQMEWSLMSTPQKTGWLYFAKPESNDPLWEFGPCARSNFRELIPSDLQVEFVRNGDTNRIRSAFDADLWLEKFPGQILSARAIPVKQGQTILARLISSPRTVYAIRLIDQRGTLNWGSISVEYVCIDLNRAEPGGAANRSQPAGPERSRAPAAAGSGR